MATKVTKIQKQESQSTVRSRRERLRDVLRAILTDSKSGSRTYVRRYWAGRGGE